MHRILHYVTLTRDVYEVCHCVGRCVKMGVAPIKHRSESQWTVLLRYLTMSTNVRCNYRVVYYNFVFQQDESPVHLVFNTVQLLQCKNLAFLSPELWPHNSPELNSTNYETQSI